MIDPGLCIIAFYWLASDIGLDPGLMPPDPGLVFVFSHGGDFYTY